MSDIHGLNLYLAASAPEQINPSPQVLGEIDAVTFPSPVDSKPLKVLEINHALMKLAWNPPVLMTSGRAPTHERTHIHARI